MAITELPHFDDMLAFHGRQTTGYDGANGRTEVVGETFGIPEENRTVILDLPTPEHMQAYVSGRTVIVDDHGDGGCKANLESVTGIVLDNPEASALNFDFHDKLAQDILYVAMAGGNANNFALSALGRYAREPQLLASAQDLRIGYHRPLIYNVAEGDRILRHGCITSGIGIGGAARVAAVLDEQKPNLRRLDEKRFGRERRLGKETLITTAELMNAEPFSAEISITTDTETSRETFDSLTGIEVIGSRVYAKAARTRVNVNDPNHQVVISRHHQLQPIQFAGLLAVSAQLKTGLHPKKRRVNFTNTSMTIRATSDHVVPFQVDGEYGESYQLAPGQTLRLRLARIAVPTLMKR